MSAGKELTQAISKCQNSLNLCPFPRAIAYSRTQMATNREMYNIVVIGSMNPRIHTPAWYRLVGLIDDAELEEAVKHSQTAVHAAFAHWQIKDIGVDCVQSRWEVATTNAVCLERLRNMTVRVFDEFLNQTQVSAVGFNFNYWRVTDVSDFGRYLGSRLAKTQIGLKEDGLVSGELSLRRSAHDRSILVAIRPSDEAGSESVVNVLNNYEYRFTSTGKGFFRLDDTLSPRFFEDLRDAEEQASRVVQAINQSRERP